MYINGHDNKNDVIQNVIENIDDGLLSNAKDMLNQLKEITNGENTMKKQKNKMKTVYEYMTVFFAILGTLAMVAAVGSLETNQYLLFAAAVSTGFASFIMSLFSQQLYSEAK